MEFAEVGTGWFNKLRLRFPALVLLGITLLFWGNYDRYQPVAEPLLQTPLLVNALRTRGDASQTNDTIRLHVPTGGKNAEARFRILEKPAYSTIRLEGRIRTQNVVRGKYPWSSARLLLIQRDAKGKWIPGTHGLLDEEGTVPWTFQQQEFEVFPGAATVEVVLQQIGKSGTAWFDQIIAVPVELKSTYRPVQLLFLAAWLWMGFLYFRRCRLDRRKLRILILLNVFAILCGTLAPTLWIQKPVDGLKLRLEQLQKRLEANEPKPVKEKPKVSEQKSEKSFSPKPVVREKETVAVNGMIEAVEQVHRIGHFALFATLCFLVYCSAALEGQSREYFGKVAFDILLFAAVTESLQYLTMDRTPGFSDWIIDVCGMVVAFLLFGLVRFTVPVFSEVGKS
ncbi:VanZ family protein [Pontiella agarivorans]|uniref:VanZ family protein n=1 Tax=Pontiella agarivorans TaxID=3038953 RepID=A0ABU5MZ48_9BACT|nr:VanZ family protein [Pontiella agarivorans]MDZ8119465.1 VanZ family protein [Pontiella agarivorans]